MHNPIIFHQILTRSIGQHFIHTSGFGWLHFDLLRPRKSGQMNHKSIAKQSRTPQLTFWSNNHWFFQTLLYEQITYMGTYRGRDANWGEYGTYRFGKLDTFLCISTMAASCSIDLIYKVEFPIPDLKLVSLSFMKITPTPDTTYLTYLSVEIRSHTPETNHFMRNHQCIIP